jgi:hypothetical protein
MHRLPVTAAGLARSRLGSARFVTRAAAEGLSSKQQQHSSLLLLTVVIAYVSCYICRMQVLQRWLALLQQGEQLRQLAEQLQQLLAQRSSSYGSDPAAAGMLAMAAVSTRIGAAGEAMQLQQLQQLTQEMVAQVAQLLQVGVVSDAATAGSPGMDLAAPSHVQRMNLCGRRCTSFFRSTCRPRLHAAIRVCFVPS